MGTCCVAVTNKKGKDDKVHGAGIAPLEVRTGAASEQELHGTSPAAQGEASPDEVKEV